MDERTQQYLDGEVGRRELTPEELRKAAPYEPILKATRHFYQSVEAPDLTDKVMARIQTGRKESPDSLTPPTFSGRLVGHLRWLWAPHRVNVRPVYGALAASLLLAALLLNPGVITEPSTPPDGKVFVQFRLDARPGSEVRLAGSFTGWEPSYPLQEVFPGTWSVLVPLEPGVHNYAFVINGQEWVADPAAPAVADGFGGVNSRISVLLPGDTPKL